MPLARVSQSGNVSIPKIWRDKLGIALNSNVELELKDDKIIINPLSKMHLKDALKKLRAEFKAKKIVITREEAIKDDLYD